MMKFDANLAWKQATAAMSANRDLLLALAGVFFLLPSLAFGLFMPQPTPNPGASEAQVIAMVRAYYVETVPFVLLTALVQAVGTLAALTLFTDRTRPTVGEAIKLGLICTPIYIAAQLLIGLGFGLAGSVALALASASGSRVVAGIVAIAVIAGILYIFVKTALVAPIVAVERQRNPIAAIRRSWALTRGNSLRIAVFYLLLSVVALIAIVVIMALVGIALAFAVDQATGRTISTVVSSAIGAVMVLYFVAILAAVHRQLAGPSTSTASEPFE